MRASASARVIGHFGALDAQTEKTIAAIGSDWHTNRRNETVLASKIERATNTRPWNRNIDRRSRRNHSWGASKTVSRRIGRRLRHDDVIREDSVLRSEKTALNGSCRPENDLDNVEIIHETAVSQLSKDSMLVMMIARHTRETVRTYK